MVVGAGRSAKCPGMCQGALRSHRVGLDLLIMHVRTWLRQCLGGSHLCTGQLHRAAAAAAAQVSLSRQGRAPNSVARSRCVADGVELRILSWTTGLS